MKTYLWLTILLVCCATSKQEKKVIHSVETLMMEVMDHRVDQLQKIDFSFDGVALTARDTTLEDEGVSWKGLSYYYKRNLFFIAETSWNNQDMITRVSVKSHLLKTEDGLGVGEDFAAIKSQIRFNSWTEFPDGYVAFKDSLDARITYLMDTGQYPQLREGALLIEKIPANLPVQEIIIQ
jgi:hypothetical protein